MPDDAPEVDLGARMPDAADEAVAIAKRNFGITLDYSPESFADVDTILSRLAKGNLLATQKIDDIWYMSLFWAGYIGEVCLHQHGGAWVRTLDEPLATGVTTQVSVVLRVSGEHNRVYCSPLDRVFQRLTGNEGDDIQSYYSGIKYAITPEASS